MYVVAGFGQKGMFEVDYALRAAALAAAGGMHYASPLDRQTYTDRHNFGHTNCGCIDRATVYGSQGPAK